MAKKIRKSAKRAGKKMAVPKGKSIVRKNAKKAGVKANKFAAPKQAKKVTAKKVKKLEKKTKKATAKAAKAPLKPVSKVVSAKKSKTLAKKKGMASLLKAVKARIRSKAKTTVAKKVIPLAMEKTSIAPRKKTSVVGDKPGVIHSKAEAKTAPETRQAGEDLHFIPDHKERPPVTTFEVHTAENQFHHREEVSFHQENKKVKNAMPSQKKFRSYNRSKGR